MPNPSDHRKRIEHVDEPGHAHELTFSCYQRRPLLLRHDWPELLSAAIDSAMSRHCCTLIAFVYMPEHVHLLVFPNSQVVGSAGTETERAHNGVATISQILYAIKRPVSYRIKQDLIRRHDALLDELTVRERPGKTSFRFWQEGGGYDRNMIKSDLIRRSVDYIHRNPVRRGLCGHPSEWK